MQPLKLLQATSARRAPPPGRGVQTLLEKVKTRVSERVSGRSGGPPKKSLILKNPESELLANIFADMGEKRGEDLAKNFADFRPSVSRKSGRKKFHAKSSTTSTSHEIKFFHRETLGAWGDKESKMSLRSPKNR